MWEQQLLNIQSKGQLTEKPGGLAGLAARRALTGSQYFTPVWVSQLIGEIIQANTNKDAYYSVLDNSMGSGRLFMWANPEQFSLSGCDIDKEKVSLVGDALSESGFSTNFIASGIEDVELGEYSIAVINPPFSITLSSPNLEPFDGVTTFGRFGANTSALSHEYALQQALKHAKVVFAVLPKSQAKQLGKYRGQHRLAAVYDLPANAFSQEGVTHVETTLCVFDSGHRANVVEGRLTEGTKAPALRLDIPEKKTLRSDRIMRKGVDETQPVVTLPVTRDNRVRIYVKQGDVLGLRFQCGLQQALCLNALYQHRLESTRFHRYPSNVKYAGEGKLWLQAHLFDDDPIQSLQVHLVRILEAAGASVTIDTQVIRRLKRLRAIEERQSLPFGKWIYQRGGVSTAVATLNAPLDVFDFNSPLLRKGSEYDIQLGADNHTLLIEGQEYEVSRERAEKLFDIKVSEAAGSWLRLHESVAAHFPSEAKRIDNKLERLGIKEWLSWGMQQEDVIQLLLKESGVCGYKMGLGKSRMAMAMGLMGGKHNLIVVKGRLLNEFLKQMEVLSPEQRAQFSVIRDVSDIECLNKVNITTYQTLKTLVKGKTIAAHLKHRIHTVIADEGRVMCNRTSQQASSLWELSAKRRYLLDGEILTGYARHALPIFQFLSGSNKARYSQPYALHDAYLHEDTRNSLLEAQRGVTAFTERHVTIVWSTNQFKEEITDGAKREVPRIKNIEAFRDTLADRFILRRVHGEPQVEAHVKMPVPTINPPTVVDWDYEHLKAFVATAENYAQWLRDYEKRQANEGKSVNLFAILQEVLSIVNATNTPYKIGKHYQGKPVTALTSKMRKAIEMMTGYVTDGRRPIMFAHSPSLLAKLSRELTKQGHRVIVIDGQVDFDMRTELLDAFQAGEYDMALLSINSCQDGLNLPAADRVLFYDRDWEARAEAQAIARVLRPEQKNEVVVDYIELPGSIDVYQAQVIDWKKTTCLAGLDYGEDYQDEEFFHHKHFIMEFIESIPGLRDQLKQDRLVA